MSKVVIQGNASGTGNFTIAAPNSDTNRTLTLPDEAGTVLTTATAGVPVNGPAFRAYRGADQSISNSTATKVQLNTENFDTADCFDSTTNYRFTPTVAGYYQFSAVLNLGGTSVTNAQAQIRKNGATASQFVFYAPGETTQYQINATLSDLIYMNGSTDYVELYGYISAGSGNIFGGGTKQAFLSGYLARSA
jgi:hypothetical protein